MATIKRKPYDWITLSLYFSLLIIGWLMVFASSYNEDEAFSLINLGTVYGKQSLWIIMGILTFGLTLLIDPRFWKSIAYGVYGLGIVLLVLVLIFGTEIKGSRSWFHLGPFSFQPAEFMKFGAMLAVASFLSYYKTKIKNRRDLLLTCALFLFPAILILLQPDAGSALVFFSFFIMLYREGLSSIYYILVFSAICLFIVSLVYPMIYVINGILMLTALAMILNDRKLNQYQHMLIVGLGIILSYTLIASGFNAVGISVSVSVLVYSAFRIFFDQKFRQLGLISSLSALAVLFSFSASYAFNEFLKPHQQERINVWLQPELCDPRGSLYNVLQSKIAIGSGGVIGKGFLEGTMTKLNYVPEQTTDFIFCTIGEEQGFVGVAGIILLFSILIVRIVLLAERAYGSFERVYGYSLAGILFMHFIVNVGMTMGLLPIIGIPLPYLSYGGSSMIIFSLMLGVMIKFDQRRGR